MLRQIGRAVSFVDTMVSTWYLNCLRCSAHASFVERFLSVMSAGASGISLTASSPYLASSIAKKWDD